MCKCCLWCLEKFMRFINRNAYIVCAMKVIESQYDRKQFYQQCHIIQSTNFCKSALDAFNLIMRNLVRVVVLDSVVDFLLFLGKLVIVLITGATSYCAFAGEIPEIKVSNDGVSVFNRSLLFLLSRTKFRPLTTTSLPSW